MDTETLSTTIDTDPGPSAAGAGAPKIADPTPIPDARDDLEAAFREADAKDDQKAEQEEAKVEKLEAKEVKDDKKGAEPKAEPEGDVKTADKAKPDDADGATGEKDEAKDDQKADRRHPDAPAKFLPRAKELWRNTPNEVKAEVNRVLAEAEAESVKVRETTQRYENLRPFDELAKSNGRDLVESLTKLNHIENSMKQNPIAALNAILMEVGPRKADGMPFSIMEVAEFLSRQGPQGYHRIVSDQPQQRQQGNPEVGMLKTEIAQMKAEAAAREIIEPFKRSHPRYDELEGDIAFFLESSKIPASLSAPERLAAAYDMAARINPSSNVEQAAAKGEPASDRRADNDFGGSTKSIKSSPGSVSEDVDSVAANGETIEQSLWKELKRMRA